MRLGRRRRRRVAFHLGSVFFKGSCERQDKKKGFPGGM